MKRTFLVLLATVAALLCGARQANADGITYTESDTATGSIGGQGFTNALVTLTFVGNTSNVTSPSAGLFFNSVGTASVTIGGIGTFLFTTVEVFDNQNVPFAGFDDASQGTFILLATTDPSFLTYDLTTGIGPITNGVTFNSGLSFATSGGSLILDSAGANSTFTATATTPEPCSLLLLGMGIAGLFTVRGRRLL